MREDSLEFVLLGQDPFQVPAPAGDADAPLQMQVSSIDYSPYLGRLGIGKITGGKLETGTPVLVANKQGKALPSRITKIYRFNCNEKVETESAAAGEIVAVAGLDDVSVGDTYTDPDNPQPMDFEDVDPPTLTMNFLPNNIAP